MKTCHVCHESKPVSEYYVHKGAKDGHGYTCKVCSRARSRRWNKEHPDRANETQRRYWAAHASKKNEKRKQARQTYAGATKRAAERKRYWEKHKERLLAEHKEWEQSPAGQEYVKVYRADPVNKERNRAKHLFRKYELDPVQYQALIDQQKGVCAICKEPPEKQWAVDHDHKTGAVRGLLCPECNWGLGKFEDNPTRLQAAIEYLQL